MKIEVNDNMGKKIEADMQSYEKLKGEMQ